MVGLRQRKFDFRVNDSEYEKIKHDMEKLGLKDFSKYFRMMLMNGEVKVVCNFEVEAINKLVMELSRVGNNVNQIARIANATSKVFKSELAELLEIEKMIDINLREILKTYQHLK